MPRLKTIDPQHATGRVKEIFDGPLKGKAFNIFKAMGNSPAALEGYLGLAHALGKTSLSGAEREVIQLAVGEANGCSYCTAAHTVTGRHEGLTDAQMLGARRGSIEDNPRLDALAKFALALHEKRGWVSDDDLTSFKSVGFDDTHIADVLATYAMATYTNYFNHINQTEVDFPPAPNV